MYAPSGSSHLQSHTLDCHYGEPYGYVHSLHEEGACVFWGAPRGDFNAHMYLASTSQVGHPGQPVGQNVLGATDISPSMLVFAQTVGLHLCTCRVSGGQHSGPTSRATYRSVALQPDHIFVSKVLQPTVQSIVVGEGLLGSDHYHLLTLLGVYT